MPIRPENRHRYPPDWPQISLAIKERAGWRCECGRGTHPGRPAAACATTAKQPPSPCTPPTATASPCGRGRRVRGPHRASRPDHRRRMVRP
ncbi:hypothetical protein CJI59_22145 [Streptomyces sp. Alain-F2R5]|nr:hypothetical protein CJI59_22145 [Streptomyces sp. Alain-F2R5]